MNKIFLIIVICFLANTQGSTRTRRALPPGFSVLMALSIAWKQRGCVEHPAHIYVSQLECPQGVWSNLNSASLGLWHCQITNLDPCGESLKNNFEYNVQNPNHQRSRKKKYIARLNTKYLLCIFIFFKV